MPSRPVLIGRGLVTHTPTNNQHQRHNNVTTTSQQDVEQTASTNQNLNQQTHPQHPTPHNTKGYTPGERANITHK